MEDIILLKDFAKYVGVSVATARSWIENGLPVVRLNWNIRIRVSDYEQWIKDQTYVCGKPKNQLKKIEIDEKLIFKSKNNYGNKIRRVI